LSLPSFGGLILPRYVGATFVQIVAVCFAALFVGYLLVDVLERLEWFARHHATAIEAVRFYGARSPLLMSRVGPVSLLAAAALTVSQLERRGELVAMQACGLSVLRSLAPISAVALLAAPAYFFLSDSIVPRTNALADYLKVTEIKRDESDEPSSRFVWYRAGGSLLQADRMDREQGVASDVTIYELDDRGFPRARIDAREARELGGGEWELEDPRRVEISGFGVSNVAAATRVQLGERIEAIDPMHLDVRALAGAIRHAREDGYGTTILETDLQARLAAPFACILLPSVVVAGALGGRRARSASRGLLLAAALAIGFELVGDLSLSLGYGERISPLVAAWAPVGLLGLIVAGLSWRGSR
jgi:lipopolysaccharide export system permease protein